MRVDKKGYQVKHRVDLIFYVLADSQEDAIEQAQAMEPHLVHDIKLTARMTQSSDRRAQKFSTSTQSER